MEALHAPGAALPRAEPRPLQPMPATEAEAAACRAALQPDITRRWSNDDLAQSARTMDGAAGRAVYADAMQTVVWFYVDPITYGRLVAAGVESLRAALDNPEFRRRFPEADDADRRERFAQGLDILDLKVRAADPVFAFQAADWLAVAMEKNRTMLGLPDGAIVAEFLFGAFDSLDPWSRFLTPEMDRTYSEQTQGAYVGIGAEMTSDDRRFFIKRVFEGGGAAGAGLKAGDEILAVDGRPVEGLSLAELGRLLRGKSGTTVILNVRLQAEGVPEDVPVERHRIHVPAVRDTQILDAARGIGYVRLAEFQQGAADQLRGALTDLSVQGAKALILDLRDNPGGELFEAVGIVGLFVSDGPVIRTRGRMIGSSIDYDVPWPPSTMTTTVTVTTTVTTAVEKTTTVTKTTSTSSPAWRGPMAVLVNGDSASASEIVASALKERSRATLVGQRTFGKGCVQIAFPVMWGSGAVLLTMARVYDISSDCLDGRGVTPGLAVAPASAPPASLAEDPVVQAAESALTVP